MTSARAILADLAARGIELRLDGDRILYRPAAALPAELAERLHAARADLALEIDARSDPFTASVLDIFDGEVVPDDEWFETASIREPEEGRP